MERREVATQSRTTSAVTREIKRRVWPSLRAHGFSDFTGRNAWRSDDDFVSVINFQTVQSKYHSPLYLGNHRGQPFHATMSSFAVNAGVYLKAGHQVPWAQTPAPARPEEWECHFRLQLTKRIKQHPAYPAEIWGVTDDGTNIEQVVQDAADQIESQAIPWFQEQSNLQAAFVDYAQVINLVSSDSDSLMFTGLVDHDIYTGLALRLHLRNDAMAMWTRLCELPTTDEDRRQYRVQFGTRQPFWQDTAKDRLQILLAQQDQ